MGILSLGFYLKYFRFCIFFLNKINNKFIKLILGKFRCILFLKIINFTIKIISENIEKKINCCFFIIFVYFLITK